MSIFDKTSRKLRQLENGEGAQANVLDTASKKTSEVIKTLSGKNTEKGVKLIDNFVLFTNASGGTGVSSLLSNVAYNATTKGIKVCVVDLNIICPMQPSLISKTKRGNEHDMVAFLLGKSGLSDCIDSSGAVHMIYAGDRTILDELYCNDRTPIVNLEEMFSSLRQYYDLVLVDCPMRMSSRLENQALYMCDSMYMVWDESLGSMLNTERVRRSLALSGIDSFTKMKVILNKRTNIHYTQYPFEKMNLELVEVLPFTTEIISSNLKGQLFTKSGATNEKNAVEYAEKVDSLTDKILENCGYVK